MSEVFPRICRDPCPDYFRYYYKKDLCRKCNEEGVAKREQRRIHRKAYNQRPEVRKRIKAYNQSPKVPVMDCFEKDKPITLEELCKRSGGGRGWALRTLRDYQKLGLVIKTNENLFQLNPNSPLRMAVDGYFREHEWDGTTQKGLGKKPTQ